MCVIPKEHLLTFNVLLMFNVNLTDMMHRFQVISRSVDTCRAVVPGVKSHHDLSQPWKWQEKTTWLPNRDIPTFWTTRSWREQIYIHRPSGLLSLGGHPRFIWNVAVCPKGERVTLELLGAWWQCTHVRILQTVLSSLLYTIVKLHLNRGEDSWFWSSSFWLLLLLLLFFVHFFSCSTIPQKLKQLFPQNFHTRWGILRSRELLFFHGILGGHLALAAILLKTITWA